MYFDKRTETGPAGCDCPTSEEANPVYDSHTGDYVCTTCARVIESHCIDEGQDWFGAENARAVAPHRDAEFVSTDNGAVFRGKRRFAAPDPDKKLRQWLKEVERCAAALHFDAEHQVTVAAKRFFVDHFQARATHRKRLQESDKQAAAACAVYFGCKTHDLGVARSIKEISGNCGVPINKCTDMLRSYKAMVGDRDYAATLFKTVRPEDLLLRALGGLRLEHRQKMQVDKAARDLFALVSTKGLLEGKTPETVCAAVVYLALEQRGVTGIAKAAVAKACAISDVTLNKAFKELKKHL